MPKTKTLLLATALAVLTSCTTPTTTSYGGSTASSQAATMYGDYLAASYASYVNDADARSNFYSRAFARQPGDLGANLVISFWDANPWRPRSIPETIRWREPLQLK